jgi:hypothetical protein
MDRLAANDFPTSVVCYLLPGQGERFPFAHPQAESFVEGKPRDAGESYAAQLQSIGFVERWGYEILEECGVKTGDRVLSTGAAAKSPVLSQLRPTSWAGPLPSPGTPPQPSGQQFWRPLAPYSQGTFSTPYNP